MKFESYALYSYSRSPSLIHSIWGEFEGVEATEPFNLRVFNPQVAALGKTLDAARHELPFSALLLDGDPATPLPEWPHIRFESRYRLEEHNGRMGAYGKGMVQLLDASDRQPLDYSSLLRATSSAAMFYMRGTLSLDSLRQPFEKTDSLERFRANLFSHVAAYIGFDHDAFFTFETRETDLVRDALQSAKIPER